MEKISILHLLTAAKNASPFDVNMAFDAGFDKVMPYANVSLQEVAGLTQDAIFSRSPSGVKREALFIGGRDINLALDMQAMAKQNMFAPFEISTFSDPSGAFTTAAAMMAKVEFLLELNFDGGFSGRKVCVFGAGGPVGGCAAIIAALSGADVELIAHRELSDMLVRADAYNVRYNIQTKAVRGSTPEAKLQALASADVVICAAAAGVRVLDFSQLTTSNCLKVVADVNAVPPSGVEGIDAFDNGKPVAGTSMLGVGALAIGKLKYDTQHNLLKKMLASDKPVHLDFISAFEMARESCK